MTYIDPPFSMTSHLLTSSGQRTLCGRDLSTPYRRARLTRLAHTIELAEKKGILCKRCKSIKLAERE